MPPRPPTTSAPARDTTSRVIRAGMLLLLFLGVAGVFGESLWAIVAPAPHADTGVP